jgi:hypothetical protein
MNTMARYVYTIFSNAVSGKEDEYNRWYSEQHLDDVLRVPGFVAAQRFRLAVEDAAAPAQYLAIYELETDDPQKTLAELHACAGTRAMPISPALDVVTLKALLYGAITAHKRA